MLISCLFASCDGYNQPIITTNQLDSYTLSEYQKIIDSLKNELPISLQKTFKEITLRLSIKGQLFLERHEKAQFDTAIKALKTILEGSDYEKEDQRGIKKLLKQLQSCVMVQK